MALDTKSNNLIQKVAQKEALTKSVILQEKLSILNSFLNFKLRESNELANLGYAASGVIHDISASLAAIMLNLEFLYDNLAKTPQKQDLNDDLLTSISTALDSAEKINLIIGNFRTQLKSGNERCVLNFSQEILDCVKLLNEKFVAKQIDLVVECPQNVAVFASKSKLYQLLVNLLTNAFEAVEKKHKDKKIYVAVEENESFIKLQIADNGRGFDGTNVAHIFEPLYTTKAGGHMGLGLYICKEIVESEFNGSIEMYRGRIESNNEKQTVTVVEIVIPKLKQASSQKY